MTRQQQPVALARVSKREACTCASIERTRTSNSSNRFLLVRIVGDEAKAQLNDKRAGICRWRLQLSGLES